MKKIILGTTMLVFGMMGTAIASPTSWTDIIDWNPDQYIGSRDKFQYTHELDGFVGYAEGGDDYIDFYSLTVSLYDDKDRRGEVALINQPGLLGDGFYDFDYSNETYGWSLAGLISLNLDGSLDVSIDSWYGDFYLDSSALYASGDNGAAPVPEPATMLLFGTGIAGLAGLRGRRNKKK